MSAEKTIGVDDVDAELDALERRAPDDRQRDRAEDELEEELRLDRRVGEAHDRERRLRVAVVAQEEPGVADDVARRRRRRRSRTAQYRCAAIEKFVRIFATTVPAFLPREKPISRNAKPACMNITSTAGDDHPHRVDADRVRQAAARTGRRKRRRAPAVRQAGSRRARTPKERLMILLSRGVARVCGRGPRSIGRWRKIAPVFLHVVEASPAGEVAPARCWTRDRGPPPRASWRLRRGSRGLSRVRASHIQATRRSLTHGHRPASTTSPPRSGAPTAARSGTTDLTQPGADVFGANVFGPAEQRQRLPKDVFKQLQATLDRRRAARHRRSPTPVAAAMKDWAMEKGATHYTHWFQPLTGMTAEKHDSFFGPDRRRHRASPSSPARSSSRASRTRRRSRPAASARRSRPAATPRGTRPRRRSSSRTPTARYLCIPTAFVVVDGRGARPQDPAAALDGRAVERRRSARCGCSATTTPSASSRRSAPSRSTS